MLPPPPSPSLHLAPSLSRAGNAKRVRHCIKHNFPSSTRNLAASVFHLFFPTLISLTPTFIPRLSHPTTKTTTPLLNHPTAATPYPHKRCWWLAAAHIVVLEAAAAAAAATTTTTISATVSQSIIAAAAAAAY